MAEIEPGASLFPNGVPWLYALFAMLFVFFLFVMFSPFLLEIDQHMKQWKCWGGSYGKEELLWENVCMEEGELSLIP